MEGLKVSRLKAAAMVAVSALLATSRLAFAGGGPENMLLVVNPNDESSLRMANAYATARGIPDRNILFINAPTGVGYKLNTISYSTYTSNYLNAIPAAITARGLDSQIDYIGTLGAAQVVNGSTKNSQGVTTALKSSFSYILSQNTQIQRGLTYPDTTYRAAEPFQVEVPYTSTGNTPAALPYAPGSNTAIHHSTHYATPSGSLSAPGYNYGQVYMTANVGYSGTYAITTQQWIDSYARSVSGDGTKPGGKIYYIENDDIRSDTREPYWPSVQAYMTAHNIAWEQDRQLYDGSPNGKSDVLGAIVGSANYKTPNGSTYLPGSYADSLTSSGGSYGGAAQTKADKFIRSGAAATAGSVTEPYAIQDRFTQSTFYIFQHDGSTLGEAFAKSVKRPDDLMFEGDLLSQVYADVPKVTLTGVTNGQTVSGTFSINATATLTNPAYATGIAKLELYVDGVDKGSIAAASGTFNLNSTSLSDGRHEVRVVGINNSQAASEGYSLSYINVNNKGQSISTSASNFLATYNQAVDVSVSAAVGTGGVGVTRVELRSLGRTVGQINGAAGDVVFNASLLAYGNNTLIPIAVMADGSEVAGGPIVVNRDFNKLAGHTVTAVANRLGGLQFEYFTGKAGNTIATSNFAGPADVVTHGTNLSIDPDNTTPANVNMPSQYLNGNNGNLAIRVTTKFEISTQGEYGFFFDAANANFESLQLSIDGTIIGAHEFWNGTTFSSAGMTQGADTLRSAYLLTGEHDFQLLLGNAVANTDATLQMIFSYKNLNGDSAPIDSTFFYTATPEPGSLSLAAVGMLGFFLKRRRISK